MQLPFDQSKLDKLLDEHGIDFLIINDKNTAQYLLGGYKFFFFAQKDSIGISRYLPTIGYPKGRPEMAFYIGHMLEGQQQEVEPLWIKDIKNIQWNTGQAGHEAAKKVIELGYSKKRIGIELCNTPTDTYIALKKNLPDVEFVDVLWPPHEQGDLKVRTSPKSYSRISSWAYLQMVTSSRARGQKRTR